MTTRELSELKGRIGNYVGTSFAVTSNIDLVGRLHALVEDGHLEDLVEYGERARERSGIEC